MAGGATGGEPERAGLASTRAGSARIASRSSGVASPCSALLHHVRPHRGVRARCVPMSIARGMRSSASRYSGNDLPVPLDALGERGAGDVLDALHQLDEPLLACPGRTGAKPTPQLPSTAVVTPCQHDGVRCGSQVAWPSKCVCTSTKPGVTSRPSASIVAPRRAVDRGRPRRSTPSRSRRRRCAARRRCRRRRSRRGSRGRASTLFRPGVNVAGNLAQPPIVAQFGYSTTAVSSISKSGRRVSTAVITSANSMRARCEPDAPVEARRRTTRAGSGCGRSRTRRRRGRRARRGPRRSRRAAPVAPAHRAPGELEVLGRRCGRANAPAGSSGGTPRSRSTSRSGSSIRRRLSSGTCDRCSSAAPMSGGRRVDAPAHGHEHDRLRGLPRDPLTVDLVVDDRASSRRRGASVRGRATSSLIRVITLPNASLRGAVLRRVVRVGGDVVERVGDHAANRTPGTRATRGSPRPAPGPRGRG